MSPITRYLSSLSQRRVSLALTAAALYLTPPLVLSLAALWLAAPAAAWSLFSIGLFMAATGTLLLLTLWRYREAYLIGKIAPLYTTENSPEEQHDKILLFQQNLEEYQKEQARYTRELDLKNETLARLSQELELYRDTFNGERDKYRRDTQSLLDQIHQHKALLEEYQQQIAHQRQEIAAHEQTIVTMENKVRDLTFELRDKKYELQTLLKLNDVDMDLSEAPPYPHPIEDPALISQEECLRTPGEALLLLKRCFEAARKIAAPSYYTPQHAPFGHAAATSHPLDLRRLCDNLRSERGAALLLYSPKEEKILYASPHIEALTGASAEEWKADGHAILGNAVAEWRSAIHRLTLHGEMLLTLALPTRDAAVSPFHAYLGAIPSGLFRHYVIAVLFRSQGA